MINLLSWIKDIFDVKASRDREHQLLKAHNEWLTEEKVFLDIIKQRVNKLKEYVDTQKSSVIVVFTPNGKELYHIMLTLDEISNSYVGMPAEEFLTVEESTVEEYKSIVYTGAAIAFTRKTNLSSSQIVYINPIEAVAK
jgi:hypothetical protein